MILYRWTALAAALTVALTPACSDDGGTGGTGTGTALPDSPADGWVEVQIAEQWWLSTWSRGDGDRWVVGGTPEEGAVLHTGADGTLQPVDVAAAVGRDDIGLLNWVHGYDDGDLIVVGSAGAVLRRSGADWSFEQAPTDQKLWGVWGATTGDVWAVGGDGFLPGQATLLHDTGDGFVSVPLPELERPNVNALFKVWGSSADDVYIVGQRGVVLHWDGAALTELLVGVSDDLIAVWGTGPDRVVAVGGRNNGVAALWDGVQWRALELAPAPGLNGVWLRGDVVHAVGVFGAVVRLDFTTGETLDDIADMSQQIDLHAVHGSSDGTLVAVGGNFIAQNGPFKGGVLERALWDAE